MNLICESRLCSLVKLKPTVWSRSRQISTTRNMEGFVITNSGKRKPIIHISPRKESPPKKIHFNGITPVKEVNFNSNTQRPFRVSIEGNIGAGKSTMIKYFEHHSSIETHAEPIEWWRNLNGHNLLELLYKDINQWIFTFQSYVLLTRLKIQTSEPKDQNTTVQMFERSVQNNRYCFLESVYKAGTLHSADYTILDRWYRWIRENVDIGLDLIVYLRTSPEIVYERVRSRGRPEESQLSLEYLEQLHESHEKWLMSNDERFNTVPVLVLDGNQTLTELYKQYKLYENVIMGLQATPNVHAKESAKRKLDV